jgi:putative effector of murein hydrolase
MYWRADPPHVNLLSLLSSTIILVVLTGIIAAILKEPFFKLMRVKDNDFVTWGITMGSTSGAIGASSLISKPRTM